MQRWVLFEHLTCTHFIFTCLRSKRVTDEEMHTQWFPEATQAEEGARSDMQQPGSQASPALHHLSEGSRLFSGIRLSPRSHPRVGG